MTTNGHIFLCLEPLGLRRYEINNKNHSGNFTSVIGGKFMFLERIYGFKQKKSGKFWENVFFYCKFDQFCYFGGKFQQNFDITNMEKKNH